MTGGAGVGLGVGLGLDVGDGLGDGDGLGVGLGVIIGVGVGSGSHAKAAAGGTARPAARARAMRMRRGVTVGLLFGSAGGAGVEVGQDCGDVDVGDGGDEPCRPVARPAVGVAELLDQGVLAIAHVVTPQRARRARSISW